MHELAHVIIGHTPARVDVTEDGALILNTYDRQQEDEGTPSSGSASSASIVKPLHASTVSACR